MTTSIRHVGLAVVATAVFLFSPGCGETGSDGAGSAQCPGAAVMSVSTCPEDRCGCADPCTTNDDCRSGCCARGYCALACVCDGEGTVQHYCSPNGGGSSSNDNSSNDNASGDGCTDRSNCIRMIEETYEENVSCVDNGNELYIEWTNTCSEPVEVKHCITNDEGRWVCGMDEADPGEHDSWNLCTENNRYWIQAMADDDVGEGCFDDPS